VRVDLLARNDFHGSLQPFGPINPNGTVTGQSAGGAAYLATRLKMMRMPPGLPEPAPNRGRR